MVECISKFQEVITTKGDPTSELLAEILVSGIEERCRSAGLGARVVKCRVYESVSCYAEWTP